MSKWQHITSKNHQEQNSSKQVQLFSDIPPIQNLSAEEETLSTLEENSTISEFDVLSTTKQYNFEETANKELSEFLKIMQKYSALPVELWNLNLSIIDKISQGKLDANAFPKKISQFHVDIFETEKISRNFANKTFTESEIDLPLPKALSKDEVNSFLKKNPVKYEC